MSSPFAARPAICDLSEPTCCLTLLHGKCAMQSFIGPLPRTAAPLPELSPQQQPGFQAIVTPRGGVSNANLMPRCPPCRIPWPTVMQPLRPWSAAPFATQSNTVAAPPPLVPAHQWQKQLQKSIKHTRNPSFTFRPTHGSSLRHQVWTPHVLSSKYDSMINIDPNANHFRGSNLQNSHHVPNSAGLTSGSYGKNCHPFVGVHVGALIAMHLESDTPNTMSFMRGELREHGQIRHGYKQLVSIVVSCESGAQSGRGCSHN